MEPNKENIEKWVAALESGEYQQAFGRLQDGRGYCCLGVACVVAIDNDVLMSDNDFARFGSLPPLVRQWFGIEDPDPILNDYESATTINDSIGLNFSEIAQLIRKKYL